MAKVPPTISEPVVTKSEQRERQRKLSFPERIEILERMRERDALIAKAGLRRK